MEATDQSNGGEVVTILQIIWTLIKASAWLAIVLLFIASGVVFTDWAYFSAEGAHWGFTILGPGMFVYAIALAIVGWIELSYDFNH